MATQGILPRFTAALHDAVLRICECVGQQRTAVATTDFLRGFVPCRTKVMRIVHKCRRQGSGSASPKGRARALAPSQSYRFVNNSHDLPTDGRRPQISPEISSYLCRVGRAKSPQSSGRSPGEAVGEIILCLEPAQAEFITEQRSPAASWLDLKQLTEPHEFILASSPLQDREKP